MGNFNLMIFISFLIPMSMMFLLFKGYSKTLCFFLLAGMFICVLAGEINSFVAIITNSDLQNVSINIAPLVEEICKAIPIVFVSFLLKPSRQQLAEYSLALGVGFATLENISLFISSGDVSFFYVIFRSLGAGMMHGICTLIIGIAMRNVINNRILYFSGTLAVLSVVVIYHSIYNMLITSKFMIVGVLIPVVSFIVIMSFNAVQNSNLLKRLKDN